MNVTIDFLPNLKYCYPSAVFKESVENTELCRNCIVRKLAACVPCRKI